MKVIELMEKLKKMPAFADVNIIISQSLNKDFFVKNISIKTIEQKDNKVILKD